MTQSLFGAAKASATTTTKKADKTAILALESAFAGISAIVQEYQAKALELKNLEGIVGLHKDQILQVSRQLFAEECKKQGRYIGSFNLCTEGGAKVLIMPSDRYTKIDPEAWPAMAAKYPNHTEEKTIFTFNPEVLERVMPVLERIIMECPDISDSDKANLLTAKTEYTVKKGAIEQLPTFPDPAAALRDLNPIIAIKNV